ncbi:ubiquitin-conjugating enzyme E2-binding protein [Hypoxylon cercidicola]|nr:ubiquitin-conjugating enzyme E2-binding protein [Hypoxylon cercidicola]
MSSSNSILIYAERLSIIPKVNVSCLLHTPATSETKASISSNGQVLEVNHDGLKASIRLPGPVSSQQVNPALRVGDKYLAWALPLVTGLAWQFEQNVPWSANDLQPESPIACRQCQATVVDAGLIKVWKDLPSENWAEMMEFWHCHKPDHAHANDESLASRAYGANSRISAQSGVGFVDLTSFLLSEADISTSTITHALSSIELYKETGDPDEVPKSEQSNALRAENSPVFCASCKNQLGVLNDQTSISLFKWRVHLDEKPQPVAKIIPSFSHCFSAMLIATMTRSACANCVILPMKESGQNVPQTAGTASPPILNIRVFNSNIAFSSTQLAGPLLAVKVLYRIVSQTEADNMLNSFTSDTQDITLPADAISEVLNILERSNGLPPPCYRQSDKWKYGLLEKWDEDGQWEMEN